MDHLLLLQRQGFLVSEGFPIGTITQASTGTLIITDKTNRYELSPDGSVEAKVHTEALTRDQLDQLAGWALKVFAIIKPKSTIAYIIQDGIPHLCLTQGEDSTKSDSIESHNVLRGIPCAPGIIEGQAFKEILICKTSLDIKSYANMKGLILERGNILSHLSIMARELKIPCVMNVSDATKKIPHGSRIRLDGDTGEIRILN